MDVQIEIWRNKKMAIDKTVKMTKEEAAEILRNKLYCMELESSGIVHQCNSRKCDNCIYNYKQGTIREQKEALNMAVWSLDKDRVLDWMKEDVSKWYMQSDKQRLASDPCVVDAMIDLFIRTIDKYKVRSGE
jgi:hypothetical protein